MRLSLNPADVNDIIKLQRFTKVSRGRTMAISPSPSSLLPAVWIFYILIFKTTAPIPQVEAQSSRIDAEDRHLIDELREAEFKIAQLESTLDEGIMNLNAKSLYLRESEKLIEEMTSEADHLQSLLLSTKSYPSSANERLHGLEEEVRLLWATSRKNNFDLHALESKSLDAEKRLERATTRVETMAAIVTERWIQIRHLEQALVIAERRTVKVRRQVSSTRCSFLKFFRSQFGNLIDDWWDMMVRTWSAAKQHHHQLQRFVKQEMKKSKYTAAFANKEVVFFVASALITFPALSLGVFLLNNFS